MAAGNSALKLSYVCGLDWCLQALLSSVWNSLDSNDKRKDWRNPDEKQNMVKAREATATAECQPGLSTVLSAVEDARYTQRLKTEIFHLQ